MKGLKQLILYCTVSLASTISVQAQQGFLSRSSFGGQFHYGSFITSEPKAVYVRDSYSYFGELYFQQQAPKAARLNRPIPHWGAGLFVGHTGSKKYIGKMAGAFSFINLPLFRIQRLQSNLRLGAGLGWIEKPYHKETNHKNVLIGTAINGYINALWQNEVALNNRIFLNAGLSFSHLSNGASTLPNLGLNIPAFSFGLRYKVNPTGNTLSKVQEPVKQQWTANVYTSVGVKQVPWIGSDRYVVNVANVEAAKPVSYRSLLGGGVFLFYDRTFKLDQSDIYPLKRNVSNAQAGIYALYEFRAGRVGLPIQVGVPLLNKEANEQVFQQVGIRYSVTSKWSGQVLLKTYGGRADLIHLGVGYKIR